MQGLNSRLAVAAAFGLAAGFAGLAFAQEGGRPINVTMTGAAEKPNAGDPDGTGTASFRINPGQMQVCYTLKVSGIATATAAHIHKAPATSAGPVVVPLTAPNAAGTSEGCATTTREIAQDLIQNPGDYYVNVHNAEFGAGALRGQLTQ
jgi:hypothetical protein